MPESEWKDVSFRQFVVDCARDEELVKQFNTLHGLNVPCPIPGLGDPVAMLDNKTEAEMLAIAHFIYWIQQALRERGKAAHANLAKLQRFYGAKLAHKAGKP